jgi:hypothetical protein
MSDGIYKFLKIVESESSEDFARYEFNDRVDTIGREMFKDNTVPLDSLELPFDKNDPFLSFEVENDLDMSPLEVLSSPMSKMGEFEQLDKAGQFGISDDLADMIGKLTDKIERLGSEERLTLSAYQKYMNAVMDLISRSPHSFDDWVENNKDEISSSIDDEGEYNRDPYGYHGVNRSDFS